MDAGYYRVASMIPEPKNYLILISNEIQPQFKH